MKKFLIAFIIIASFLLTGCPGGDDEKEKENDNKMQVKKVETKAAKEFMDNYMRYLLKKDEIAVKSFYSSKAKLNMKPDIPTALEPHIAGYKLEEGEQKKEKVEMKVRIYSAYTSSPYFSEDTFKYTLILEDGRLLIEKVEKDKSIELFAMGNVLIKKEGEKVEGQKIISLDELPYFSTPIGGGEKKFTVSKDGFGPCAGSSGVKKVVVTTKGKNSLVAILEEEDSEEVSNNEGEGNETQGEESKQGGGQENKQTPPESMEKKAKFKITSVDLYFNNKIEVVNFSPDGKSFLVIHTPPDGMGRISIYKTPKGEIVKTPIESQFKPGRFSIKSAYYISPEEIVFTVEPGKDTTLEEKMLKGEWTLDIKKEKLKLSE